MQKKTLSIAATITTAFVALSAPTFASTVSFDSSPLQEDGFPGGEFIAVFEDGSSYRTFCLENDEPLNVGYGVTYSYTLDTSGTDSGGAIDPISSAAASIYVAWLKGTIANTVENSTAVQTAIWAIEDEVDPGTLNAAAQAIYDDAVANFSTTDNAITDNAQFGNLRVLNPFREINGDLYYYQSQIILIPLPASSGLALAGIAAVGMRRRR